MPSPPSARQAPGLRQLLPLPYGHAGEARQDPLAFFVKNWRRFGDVFRYQVGPWTYHLVSHPDHVRHVLQDNYRNYPRSFHYRFTRLVIGDGLVATEGDVWRRQRRMVQPAFHEARVAALAGQMADATAAMLDRWDALRLAESGEPFNVAAEMVGLTLRIVGKTLLGVDLGGETDVISPAVTEALSYLDYRMNNRIVWPLAVPTPRNLRFRRAMRTMDRVVYDIIRRRRSGGDTGDLLSMLLSVRDEETGAGMTDKEVRDQVMTFIGAGHETTAVALAWTWYLLSQHPEVERRVREEVDDVLGGRAPAARDTRRLCLTRHCFEEALRLYPPVFAVVRDVIADDEIGGYHIPAGSSVILCQFITHRHPAAWDEPERFDPDRFLPERGATRPKFAYFPFLGGPHQCVGNDFALMEAAIILSMVLQRYRLRMPPGTVVEPEQTLTLRPRGGMRMTAERAPARHPVAVGSEK